VHGWMDSGCSGWSTLRMPIVPHHHDHDQQQEEQQQEEEEQQRRERIDRLKD
jgi:hypothetical protein